MKHEIKQMGIFYVVFATVIIMLVVAFSWLNLENKRITMHPYSEVGYTISTSKEKIMIGPGYSNREIWLFGDNLTIFIQGQNCTTRIAID